jgi:hypothetical protein
MQSMKLTLKEGKEEVTYDDPSKAPEYPSGLTICLDDVSLKKLGIKELPDVGQTMYLEANVTVYSKRQYENQTGPENGLSLQITDMELEASEEDEAEPDDRSAAQKIYGKK